MLHLISVLIIIRLYSQTDCAISHDYLFDELDLPLILDIESTSEKCLLVNQFSNTDQPNMTFENVFGEISVLSSELYAYRYIADLLDWTMNYTLSKIVQFSTQDRWTELMKIYNQLKEESELVNGYLKNKEGKVSCLSALFKVSIEAGRSTFEQCQMTVKHLLVQLSDQLNAKKERVWAANLAAMSQLAAQTIFNENISKNDVLSLNGWIVSEPVNIFCLNSSQEQIMLHAEIKNREKYETVFDKLSAIEKMDINSTQQSIQQFEELLIAILNQEFQSSVESLLSAKAEKFMNLVQLLINIESDENKSRVAQIFNSKFGSIYARLNQLHSRMEHKRGIAKQIEKDYEKARMKAWRLKNVHNRMEELRTEQLNKIPNRIAKIQNRIWDCTVDLIDEKQNYIHINKQFIMLSNGSQLIQDAEFGIGDYDYNSTIPFYSV